MRKKLLLVYAFIFSLLSIESYAQNIEVKGRVTGPEGKPIDGATVIVKGTNTGTSTNANGEFTINAARGATLVVSSVDFAAKEISVDGPEVSVSLAQRTRELNEVVVTALGIRKEKKALGYSVSEVKGEELTEARTVNVANSLAGKVAGLNITGTATGPGGSSRITLRGNGSISGNNQPLIVVDGIPINNDNLGSVGLWGGQDKGDGIGSLNPDEIESISVLKGGTAAALYGSRAANGAILVTSKGGGKGRGLGVEVNSNFMVEDLLYKKFDDYQYEYGTGDNGLKPTEADPNLNQTNSFGAKLDGSSVIQFDGVSRPYVAQKDNLKNFYDVGNTFTNSVALFGSSEKVGYRFSMSNLDNKGIVPNNSLTRQNFAINVNGNLSKRLSFLVNGKYIREKNKNRPRISDSPGNANYSLYTMPTSLAVSALKESKYTADGFEKVYTNNQYVQNPWFAVEDYQQEDSKDRFIGAFEPRFNITDWLYVKARVGFDKFSYRNIGITPTGTGYSLGGDYDNSTRNFSETNSELILGFNKDLSDKFNLSGLVGGNLMKQVTKLDNYGGGPYNIPFFYDISNISPGSRRLEYRYIESRINSVYGSVDLGYQNFLYLNMTARNDWFSTLNPDDNSIFYPSVGLSAILSEAFTLPDFINYLKVRGSWAQSGGGSTDPYQLYLTYGLTGAHLNSPLAQISNTTIPNQFLKPNKSTTGEIGIEARFFNSRLGLDLALYDRKTTDDIVSASVSTTSGYESAVFNVGKVTNKGIELLLSYRAIDNSDFTWDLSYNMSYNKSEVVKLYQDLPRIKGEEPRPRNINAYQEVNQPFSYLKGVGFKRDAGGNVIFDAQGYPIKEFEMPFGSGIAPTLMGFTNTFKYKAFGLSFLVDARFGGKVFSGTNALAYRYGLHKGTLPGRETGVVGEGVTESGSKNTVNVLADDYYSRLYDYAEPFIYKSDFIKLRQVILDYNFPSKIFENTPFKAITISLVARNLWTIKKYTPNIDPESTYNNGNSQGMEFSGVPVTRSLGINLNLKF